MGFTRTVLAIVSMLFALLLAAPIVLLGLPFWGVAFFTRAIARLLQPKFVPWNQIIEFDPTVGWKPKANLNNHYFIEGDDVFHIRTDSQGWAGKANISESEVVVFGDSFAFGYGVDTDASFSEINTGLHIKPIGAPGYNMVQELLLIRQLSSKLRGKLVVWFVCLDNDLIDNIMPSKPNYYRTPFIRSVNRGDDWEVVTSHLSPTRWYYSSGKRPYYRILAELCTSNSLSRRVYSACNFLIREGKFICSQTGAHLVVMTIPNKNQLSQRGLEFLASQLVYIDGFDPDFPDKKLEEICRRWGVPFLAAKKHLDVRDYKERDPHWNKRGHRQVAKLLSDLYHDHISLRNRA